MVRLEVVPAWEPRIGTHGQLTTYSAIRVANALEEYQPFWFEEPVSPENVDEMARVAAHTSIPIASGERLVTKYEFAELIEKQAAQTRFAVNVSMRRMISRRKLTTPTVSLAGVVYRYSSNALMLSLKESMAPNDRK